jgi:hypothetical protein
VLELAGGQLVLLISDDGRGFDPSVHRPGHTGLQSMRGRRRAVWTSAHHRGESLVRAVRVAAAGQAHLSPRATERLMVKCHVRAVMGKLNAESRTQAALRALRTQTLLADDLLSS